MQQGCQQRLGHTTSSTRCSAKCCGCRQSCTSARRLHTRSTGLCARSAAAAPQVWHNYSFDRHVMERLGLRMRGFGGDTMHMARLWDSSRQGRGGYGLEALSGTWGVAAVVYAHVPAA